MVKVLKKKKKENAKDFLQNFDRDEKAGKFEVKKKGDPEDWWR